MKKTTIYFPEEMTIEIKTRAKQEKRSEAELIREAVAVYLANGKRPLPSFVGIGSGGTVSGRSLRTGSCPIGMSIDHAGHV